LEILSLMTMADVGPFGPPFAPRYTFLYASAWRSLHRALELLIQELSVAEPSHLFNGTIDAWCHFGR